MKSPDKQELRPRWRPWQTALVVGLLGIMLAFFACASPDQSRLENVNAAATALATRTAVAFAEIDPICYLGDVQMINYVANGGASGVGLNKRTWENSLTGQYRQTTDVLTVDHVMTDWKAGRELRDGEWHLWDRSDGLSFIGAIDDYDRIWDSETVDMGVVRLGSDEPQSLFSDGSEPLGQENLLPFVRLKQGEEVLVLGHPNKIPNLQMFTGLVEPGYYAYVTADGLFPDTLSKVVVDDDRLKEGYGAAYDGYSGGKVCGLVQDRENGGYRYGMVGIEVGNDGERVEDAFVEQLTPGNIALIQAVVEERDEQMIAGGWRLVESQP